MKIKKIIKKSEEEIKEMNVSPDTFIVAITKLLEIAHAHGFDDEAKAALQTCGITLEIEEV